MPFARLGRWALPAGDRGIRRNRRRGVAALCALVCLCAVGICSAAASARSDAAGAATAQASFDARIAAVVAQLQSLPSGAVDPGLLLQRQGVALPGIATFEGGSTLGLLVEGEISAASLEAAGARVGTSLRLTRPDRGPWLHSVRLPLSKLSALLVTPGVSHVEAAGVHELHLNASVSEVNADDVHQALGTPPVYFGPSGVGVLVGVIDSGIDPLHQDFRDGAGAARIESAWDQLDGGALPGPPLGFLYGTFWTGATLAGGTSRMADDDGHGTHVAGIAAGSGRATGNGRPAYTYIGMAPEATLAIVKTDLTDTGILDGVQFVFQRATTLGLPSVVNLSLGSQFGPHDGSSALEQGIDALSGPGRVVVISAGNDGGSTLHAEGNAVGGAAFTMSIPTYTPLGGAQNDVVAINAWAPDASNVTVRVQGPGGSNVGPVVKGATGQASTTDGRIEVLNGNGGVQPNGMRSILIQIYDSSALQPPNDGVWTITFASGVGTVAEVDAWMFLNSLGGAPLAEFVNGMDVEEVVASPGTSDAAITVASYVTKRTWSSVDGHDYSYGPSVPIVGPLSPFSSHGPRRDGALKPDIAAPGQGITSSLSSAAPRNEQADVWVDPDEQHQLLQGTSQAAPHVTGLVALMLEVFPNMPAHLAKAYVTCSGRADAHTGTLPNASFGFGKIDAFDALTNCLVPTVSLLDFQAQPDAAGVQVRWSLPTPGTLTQLRLERRDGEGLFALVQLLPARAGDGAALDPLPLSGPRSYRMLGSGPGITEQWLGEITVQGDGALPARLALLANVPNPFNPSTTVAFALPRAAEVDLAVFDPRGRRVRTLVHGPQPAGHRSAIFDGCDDAGRALASGVYHVRLSAEGATRARAITLSK